MLDLLKTRFFLHSVNGPPEIPTKSTVSAVRRSAKAGLEVTGKVNAETAQVIEKAVTITKTRPRYRVAAVAGNIASSVPDRSLLVHH